MLLSAKFSLRMSMNYAENVTEPLTHAQTVRSSPIFSSAWEQGQGGFHQNLSAAMGINDTNLIVNCTFLPNRLWYHSTFIHFLQAREGNSEYDNKIGLWPHTNLVDITCRNVPAVVVVPAGLACAVRWSQEPSVPRLLCWFSWSWPGQRRCSVSHPTVQGERDLRSKLLVVTLCLAIHRNGVLPLLENLLEATDRVFLKNCSFRHFWTFSYFSGRRIIKEGGAHAALSA